MLRLFIAHFHCMTIKSFSNVGYVIKYYRPCDSDLCDACINENYPCDGPKALCIFRNYIIYS